MGAEKRWHEGAPERDGEPIVPDAIHSWTEGFGSNGIFAPHEVPEWDGPERLSAGTEAPPHDRDTVADLLRAIQGTEFAARLEPPPLETAPPDAPEPAEPAEAAAGLAGFEPLFASPPPAADSDPDSPIAALLRAVETAELAGQLSTAMPSDRGEPASPACNGTAEEALHDFDFALPIETLPSDWSSEQLSVEQHAAGEAPDAWAFNEPAEGTLADAIGRPRIENRPPEQYAREAPVSSPDAASPIETSAEEETAKPSPGSAMVVADGAQRTPVLARIGSEISRLAGKIRQIPKRLDSAEIHLSRRVDMWFGLAESRRSRRLVNPPLVAYPWAADTENAQAIADISTGGLYMRTRVRWPRGSVVSMTLQRTDRGAGTAESWIAVDFQVIRWCKDGLAGAFIPPVPGQMYTVAGRAENCADKRTLKRFVKQLSMGPPREKRRWHD